MARLCSLQQPDLNINPRSGGSQPTPNSPTRELMGPMRARDAAWMTRDRTRVKSQQRVDVADLPPVEATGSGDISSRIAVGSVATRTVTDPNEPCPT